MNARVAIAHHGAEAAAGARSPVGAVMASAAAWVARLRQLRRDREYLNAMPDYLLNDIGISRLDIDHALVHGRRWVAE